MDGYLPSMQTQTNSRQEYKLAHTVTETAQILGISTRSVHRLLGRGLLHASKALRKILIPRTEIEKFLSETTEGN